MAKEHLPPSGAPEGSAALPDQGREREGLPTGENTSGTHDVADPHPSNEEDYDKIPAPGGTKPPDSHIIEVNSYSHDNNKSPPRPQSKGSRPE